MTIVLPQHEVAQKRRSSASVFAQQRVKQAFADPSLLDDPVTLLAAYREFDDQPMHQCYWNNRFCIAVAFGLETDLQRVAAWCAASNGLNGYWEWTTHSGYDAAAVLKVLDLLPQEFEPDREGMYSRLDPDIVKALVKKFHLPAKYEYNQEMTYREGTERDRFNATYPFKPVL